jgi:hypothetical protein
MATRRQPDWERIEADYRVGARSVREIATEHGISHTAIQKRAKEHHWVRNLKDKVKAKADALVAKALVANDVARETTATEQETVDLEAQVQARIRIAHRADITRMRNLVLVLLAECEAESGDPELFENLGDILRNPDEKGQDRLNEAYRKAIGLPQRIKGVKELADALRVLVAMEREAYGLDSAGPTTDPLAELLGGLRRSTLPTVATPPDEE